RRTGGGGWRGKKRKVMAGRLQRYGCPRPARGACRAATGSGGIPTDQGSTGEVREQAILFGRTGRRLPAPPCDFSVALFHDGQKRGQGDQATRATAAVGPATIP